MLARPEPEPELEPIAGMIVVSYRRGAVLRRRMEALEKAEQRKRLDMIVLDLGNSNTTTERGLELSSRIVHDRLDVLSGLLAARVLQRADHSRIRSASRVTPLCCATERNIEFNVPTRKQL